MTHSNTPQGVETRFASRETLEDFIYDHYDIDSIVLADGFDDAFLYLVPPLIRILRVIFEPSDNLLSNNVPFVKIRLFDVR